MQPNSSKLLIASAGSGKTTFLVDEALSRADRKMAILTYTNNNICEIKRKFYEKNRAIPQRVKVWSWFTFLLHQGVRPYQRSVYSKRRVRTIDFPKGHSARFTKYSETERYYFRNGDEIYSDKISRFVMDCETYSEGLVIKRLSDIYDEIFIDEFQDLSGWDLSLLETLLRSDIRMLIVGDPRQYVYATNHAAKNKQYRGIGILALARKWEARGLCQIDEQAVSHRCNQRICDYADMLWPDMKKTKSLNESVTGHDGVFVVSKDSLHEYMNAFSPSPAVLRYNRTAETFGYPALNFGDAKGLEFDRVLIVPHGPIKKYLETGDREVVAGSVEKFYVAVTRARYSVAFLYDGECGDGYSKWHARGR